jgi:hypothetical protein
MLQIAFDDKHETEVLIRILALGEAQIFGAEEAIHSAPGAVNIEVCMRVHFFPPT